MNSIYSVQQISHKTGTPHKKNQDRMSVWLKYPIADKLKENSIQVSKYPYGFYGIYDGHGTKWGHIISQIVKEFFEYEIPNNWENINSEPIIYINKLFSMVNPLIIDKLKEILEKNSNEFMLENNIIDNINYPYIKYRTKYYNNWTKLIGGTTCSIVLILENNKLYHAHLGDSECLILYNPIKGEKEFKNITKNHSASSLEEYLRISNSYKNPGKFVYSFADNSLNKLNPNVFVLDDSNNIIPDNVDTLSEKVYRLYRKHFYHKNVSEDFATIFTSPTYNHSLAISRSFGDFFLSQYGLSDKPDIIEYPLNKVSSFILASDGLWDNFTKKDIFDKYFELVKQKKTDIDIFNELDIIVQKTAKQNFGKSRDDITTILFIGN